MADKSLNRTELVAAVAAESGQSQAAVSGVVDALFSVLAEVGRRRHQGLDPGLARRRAHATARPAPAATRRRARPSRSPRATASRSAPAASSRRCQERQLASNVERPASARAPPFCVGSGQWLTVRRIVWIASAGGAPASCGARRAMLRGARVRRRRRPRADRRARSRRGALRPPAAQEPRQPRVAGTLGHLVLACFALDSQQARVRDARSTSLRRAPPSGPSHPPAPASSPSCCICQTCQPRRRVRRRARAVPHHHRARQAWLADDAHRRVRHRAVLRGAQPDVLVFVTVLAARSGSSRSASGHRGGNAEHDCGVSAICLHVVVRGGLARRPARRSRCSRPLLERAAARRPCCAGTRRSRSCASSWSRRAGT